MPRTDNHTSGPVRHDRALAGLADAFAASLDPSCLLQWADRIASGHRIQPELRGEGADFRTYFLPATPLPLALKKPLPDFLGGLSAAIGSWQRNFEALGHAQAPLVPPAYFLGPGYLGWHVMPWGSITPSLASVADDWRDLQQCLTALGLQLLDLPQLKSANGVPFICDWSDLVPRHPKGQRLPRHT